MCSSDLNGLAAVAYGPSVVKAFVGKGKEITISEETDYPFRGVISFTISTNEPVKFPLELRIPGWADSVKVTYKGKTEVFKDKSQIKLTGKWKNGDQITLELPMDLRFERRYNNSVSLLRGPLYFSLRMDKEYRSVKINYDNFGYKGSVDWEILPKSPWNYGLLIDMKNPARGISMRENKTGKLPFADQGDMIWSEEAEKYIEYQEEAPVILKARGMRIPSWSIKNNSADVPP